MDPEDRVVTGFHCTTVPAISTLVSTVRSNSTLNIQNWSEFLRCSLACLFAYTRTVPEQMNNDIIGSCLCKTHFHWLIEKLKTFNKLEHYRARTKADYQDFLLSLELQ